MSQRGKPNKAMAFASDYIALGAKSGAGASGPKPSASASNLPLSSAAPSSAPAVANVPSASISSSSSSSSSLHSKKAKTSATSLGGGASMPVVSTGGGGGGGGVSGGGGGGVSIVEKTSVAWESMALDDFDSSDLARAVLAAEEAHDIERVVGLLCGAVKLLRNQRAKPDQLLYLSLMFLAKSNNYLFSASEYVLEAFCSLLKRDVKESYKSKGNALVSVLAANVLMAAFQKERNWPEIFVRVFIDDAMGERVWVDHPDCKGFVDNIVTAFNTKMPTAATSQQLLFGKPGGEGTGREQCPSPPVGGGAAGGSGSGSGSATPTRVTDEDSMQGIMECGIPINLDGRDLLDVTVSPRYVGLQNVIEHMVMEIVREQLNRRQGTDNITRNFLKFLTSSCGLVEVRLIVISKVEMWVMNPKLSRVAHELLVSVSLNCNTHTPMDVEVIGHFCKLRFKNKPNINLYLQCAREIAVNHPENLPSLVKHTIFNELSNARNTNNMSVLSVIFSTDPERGAISLASVFMDLLLQKECYLRALRALLREIVRALRHDVSLQTFCLQLMQEKPKEQLFKEFEFKDRMFNSVTDLISLSMFLGISPSVKEAVSSLNRGEKKDVSAFKNFLMQVAHIQRDAMWWFLDVVPKLYKPSQAGIYARNLHKILFMTNHEEYSATDGWPAENDRHLYFKVTSELPLLQETLIRIFLIGLSKHTPLNGRDSIDLAEVLTKRAAALHHLETDDFHVLHADMVDDLFEGLYKLSCYSYPDTIALPIDYIPPTMAVAPSYWKMFIILILYCAHNPKLIGQVAWENYPTLRAFMEMCITNQFVFPPPTIASGEHAEVLKTKELQMSSMEKQAILTLERHLASATNQPNWTESSSLLLDQLITMEPKGPLRRPPEAVLDQLQQINQLHKIGHLLCRSRNPDFLLNILQRQGNQSMPWLADLVESSEGSLNVLPVQCLCEFLLSSGVGSLPATPLEDQSDAAAKETMVAKRKKQKQLLLHLQTLLQNPDSDKQACCETLDYFLRRLSSQQTQQRLQALKGLRMVLTPIPPIVQQQTEDEEVDVIAEMSKVTATSDNKWLLQHLPSLPCFTGFYPHISTALRHACQVENDPNAVGLYIQFLAEYSPLGLSDLGDLCLDMASIIVERSTILPAILPGPQCKADNANDTFVSLLRLFTNYMGQVIEAGPRESVTWNPENQSEMINVVFVYESRSAILHFFVVHAQIILLTYQPLSGSEAERHHRKMMSIWFASPQQSTPRAFLIETKEEAVLIPDWLKLKMIRSDSTVLVDAALRDLEPHQLVLFIQSFGIPIQSMSKLLQALDIAVKNDLAGVTDAVMDKNYMGQLVAVQHRRGAHNGKIFAEALQLSLHGHLEAPRAAAGDDAATRLLGPLTEPVIPPRSTAMIPPGHVKSTLLHIFDVGSPGRMTMKEKQDTFRTLQKFLTSEVSGNAPMMPMLDATVKAFDSILKSDLRESFAMALVQRTSFSCSLVRLVTTALSRSSNQHGAMAGSMLRICDTLVDFIQSKGTATPLIGLLENYQTRLRGQQAPPVQPKAPPKQSPRRRKEEAETVKAPPPNAAATTHDKNYERNIHKMVEDALRKRSTGHLVTSMAQLLLAEERQSKVKAEVSVGVKTKAGLFVDWLEMLDPELIQLSPEVQQQLLFSKSLLRKGDACGIRRERCSRPYLLTILTHQASWTTLRTTIHGVLGTFNPTLEASAVLDFLSACIYIPKLWLGRDKHVPKHETRQDVLALTNPQLIVTVDYLLEETKGVEAKEAAANIKERMGFITCCLSDRRKSACVADHLVRVITDLDNKGCDDIDDGAANGGRRSCKFANSRTARELLLQIYMKLPNSLLHLTNAESLLSGSVASLGNTSSLDCVSHTLLSALAATQHGRPWASQMLEFEASARKVAASHPLLVLRNLPLIAASLKGRTEYEFSFFRSRNHLTLYSVTLGLLEVLKPYVFRPEYQVPLEEALVCYFDMLRAYFNRRDSFFGVIDKFATFLHEYLDHEPRRAAQFVQRHGQMLPEMQRAMSALVSLKQLVARVNYNTLGSSQGTSSLDAGGPTASIAIGFSYVQQVKREALAEANRMNVNLQKASISPEEIAGILNDLGSMAMAKPYILEQFVGEIGDHISHTAKSVRNQAYVLMLRYLRYSPKSSHELSEAYIACLQSEDHCVTQSALEKLPDLAVLLQDRLTDILQTAFCLGLYSNMNVTTFLTETIGVMNTQAGY